MALAMCAEMTFTLYVTLYGFSNLLGHLFKLLSFWLLFVAIARSMLIGPYEALKLEMEEHMRTEEKLRLAATAFDAHEGIIILDRNKNILQVNNAFMEATGYSEQELIGRNPRMLNSNRQDKTFYRKMWHEIENQGHWHGELWVRRKDGEFYPIELSVSTMKNAKGEITHYLGHYRDLSEQKQAEQLEAKAYFDPLTNLPNRHLLNDRLEQAVARAKRHGHLSAMLFVDLDNFKPINDNQGHAAGDAVLQEVAARLKTNLREVDAAVRLGGDEFVLLLENVGHEHEESKAQALTLGDKIRAALALPYSVDGQKLHLTSSIGIALFPLESDKENDPLNRADEAMYRAKKEGKNRVVTL